MQSIGGHPQHVDAVATQKQSHYPYVEWSSQWLLSSYWWRGGVVTMSYTKAGGMSPLGHTRLIGPRFPPPRLVGHLPHVPAAGNPQRQVFDNP